MIKRCERNGLSTTIVTLIIILLILVAVGTIWFVTRNVNSGKPEQDSLVKLTADLKISNVQIINYTDFNVKVEGNTSGGNVESVNFIVYGEDNSVIIRRTVSISELEKNYFQVSLHIANTSMIKDISVTPTLTSESGSKVVGKVEDTYTLSDEEKYSEGESNNENNNSNGQEQPACTLDYDCNDNNSCTTNTCSDGNCSYSPIENCVPCLSSSQCNDSNTCTTDVCSDGRCAYLQIPGCTPCGSNLSCNDNNSCTNDICMQGRCLYTLVQGCKACTLSSECNDNNPCMTDTCSNGACVFTSVSNCKACTLPSQCEDNDSSTTSSCSNGKCVYTKITSCKNNDLYCPAGCTVANDNNCAFTSSCGNGIKEGTEQCDGANLGGATCSGVLGAGYTGALKCSNICTFNTSLCVAPCTCPSDGNVCTTDACVNGVCQHTPISGCCTSSSQCGNGKVCTGNVCATQTCTPSCSNKQCGSNGCGGICGTCFNGYNCQPNGTCIKDYTDTCSSFGYNCGNKTISGERVNCGSCGPGQTCTNNVCISEVYGNKKAIIIFVDKQTYSNLKNEIDRLKSDISNDLGSQVFLFSNDWNNIQEIKAILVEKYNQFGLIGAIFIGNIPTSYFEYQNSGSTPSDWYFQDLSNKYTDSDNDGKFEQTQLTDITMRDIWTGRIKSPINGSEGTQLLKNYFDRDHNYRTGMLSYNKEMLYFLSVAINQNGITQTDYNNLANQIPEYTGLYESDSDIISIYDSDTEKQKIDYLTELPKNRDFVFVNIHGSSTQQWLGGSTYVSYNEIKASHPGALFTDLASCSNGDFTKDNYLAGWYLFSGNSLVVKANSIDTMIVGGGSVEYLDMYAPLRLGVTFGEMQKNDQSGIMTHLFGDPTLTLRGKPTQNIPKLNINTTNLYYGNVNRGSQPSKSILFKNEGTQTLKINFKGAPFSINGEYPISIDYWDVFYYLNPLGEMFRNIEILPGESKAVPFVFYPRTDGPLGNYSMTMLFQTNDPNNPYLNIKLSGYAN